MVCQGCSREDVYGCAVGMLGRCGREVGRGSKSQVLAEGVGQLATLERSLPDMAGLGRPEREEPADLAQVDVAVPVDQPGIEVQIVEGPCEEPDLVLADFAEEFGGEAEFFEEVEDLGGAVMAGRVVGRAGEAVRARAV